MSSILTSNNDSIRSAKPQVLVIDDSRVMRKAIGNILKEEFDLIEAEDGEVGWQALTENKDIQAVITDIAMPRLDGYDLLDRIRSADEPRIKDIPVIVITGSEDEETRQATLNLGATDFIVKPVDRLQLMARTRTHVRLDQTTRVLAQTADTLRSEATLDPLTQLTSRRFFLQRGTQDVAYATRHKSDLALLRLDIDNVKDLYMQYGDEIIDEILVWLAVIITTQARAEDTVARVGGTIFAILAPSANLPEARILGQRVCEAVHAAPFSKGNISIPITVSIGLATMREAAIQTIEELLAEAEKCVRAARRTGGNRLVAPERLHEAVNDDEPAEKPEPRPSPLEVPAGPEDLILEEAPSLMAADHDADTTGLVLEELPAIDIQDEKADSKPLTLEDAQTVDDPAEAKENEEPVGEPLSPDKSPEENTLDIEQALAILENGKPTELTPHLQSLIIRLLPLLDLCDRRLDLGLNFPLTMIRQKFDNPDSTE